MKVIQLREVEHPFKVGDTCTDLEPNIREDCILKEGTDTVGFYLRDVGKFSEKLSKYLSIANLEFRSNRVPKSLMSRSTAINARREGGKGVEQFSTIIGSIPPKPHMMRSYPTRSSVHDVKTAQNFIKAMLLSCRESEELIKLITPEIYEKQEAIINENIPEKFRFGRLFTSSISNFNIPAPFHIDHANLKGCVNVILAKRSNSKGGHTCVPDYDARFNSADNSMLVYPAWRSLHGVTPIVPTAPGGYRNTLVFYPLKAFKNYK